MKHVQSGVIQAVSLGFPGLLTGVLAGWVGLARANGATAVAPIIASVYWLLLLLLPVTLAVWTAASVYDKDRWLYASLPQAIVMLLIASLLGAIIGTAFFMVVAINVPAIFGGENQAELRPILMAEIGWFKLLVVMGITAVAGLGLAVWANRRVTNEL